MSKTQNEMQHDQATSLGSAIQWTESFRSDQGWTNGRKSPKFYTISSTCCEQERGKGLFSQVRGPRPPNLQSLVMSSTAKHSQKIGCHQPRAQAIKTRGHSAHQLAPSQLLARLCGEYVHVCTLDIAEKRHSAKGISGNLHFENLISVSWAEIPRCDLSVCLVPKNDQIRFSY